MSIGEIGETKMSTTEELPTYPYLSFEEYAQTYAKYKVKGITDYKGQYKGQMLQLKDVIKEYNGNPLDVLNVGAAVGSFE